MCGLKKGYWTHKVECSHSGSYTAAILVWYLLSQPVSHL